MKSPRNYKKELDITKRDMQTYEWLSPKKIKKKYLESHEEKWKKLVWIGEKTESLGHKWKEKSISITAGIVLCHDRWL